MSIRLHGNPLPVDEEAETKRERDSRLMVMLQGCFDESGSEGQDTVVVMAGFVTTAERWTHFSNEWNQMLTPHCPAFKMRSESQRKPIKERNERIAAFAEIIKRNILFKIECSISVPAFCKVVKGKVAPGYRKTSVVDDYYFWIFQSLIARLCDGVWHRGYRHQFDLFFDEQLKYGPRAKKLYRIVQDVDPTSFSENAARRADFPKRSRIHAAAGRRYVRVAREKVLQPRRGRVAVAAR